MRQPLPAKSAAADISTYTGGIELRMIEDVVEFDTQFKPRPFGDSRIFVELEIEVVESRTAQDVPSSITEYSWHFLGKGGLTEPNIRRRSARIRVRDRTYNVWTVWTREILGAWLRAQVSVQNGLDNVKREARL